jgi:hypothetical protein
MPVEREYEVIEPMVTANIYVVRARNRAEAIERVQNHQHHDVYKEDVTPDPHHRMFARRVGGTRLD